MKRSSHPPSGRSAMHSRVRRGAFPSEFRRLSRYLKGSASALGWAFIGLVVSGATFGLNLSMVPAFMQHFSGSIPGGGLDPRLPRPLAELVQGLQSRLGGAEGASLLTTLMVILMALGLLSSLGRYWHVRWTRWGVEKSLANVRQDLFERIIRAPLAETGGRGGGEFLSRLLTDLERVRSGWNYLLDDLVRYLVRSSAGLIVALWANWRLAVTLLLLLPPAALLLRRVSAGVRRSARFQLSATGRLSGITAESLGDLAALKVNRAEEYAARRYRRVSREILDGYGGMIRWQSFSKPALECLLLLGLAGVLALASWLSSSGQLLTVDLVAVAVGMIVAAQVIRPGAQMALILGESEAASLRISEILRLPPEDLGSGRPAPRHSHSLVFERVSFRYPGGGGIREVSFQIGFGELVLLTGPNGAGKTTLVRLLPRLADPQAGRILLDGEDIRELSLAQLRSQIALVAQEPRLFEASLRENILYGLSGSSEEALRKAAEQARALDFIEDLPGGFDTRLGPGGSGLSTGQMQRVLLARALLRSPRLLILDEASAHVDQASRAAIIDGVSRMRGSCTILVVTHDGGQWRGADRLLAMEEGRLAEDVAPRAIPRLEPSVGGVL